MANEVKLIITADASGAITGIRSVGGEAQKLSDTNAGVISQMKSHWLGLTAAIASTAVAINKAMDLATLSARVETLGVVMGVVGRNAGYSQEEMARFAEEVRQMGITTQESRESIIRMAQAHLDLTKASELARVAQDAAVTGNINSSEALQRMVYGIQSAQTEMLRTIGINVNFENAYSRAAAQMGKTTEALTENEKAQIRMNAVLERGRDIQGAYEAAMETTGKQLTSLPRYIEEVKLKLGDMISPALGVVVREFTENLKMLDKQLSDMSKSGVASEWAYDLADSVRDAIATVTTFAMLLDKVGGTLTAIGYVVSGGPFTSIGKQMAEWNKMFEARYKESEQYLSDLGTRAIQSAANQTAKVTDAMGTPYKDTAENVKKATKEMEQAMLSWQGRIESLNPALDEHGRKLIGIEEEAKKLNQKYGELSWITEGLARGKYFIEIARQIEESKKSLEEETKIWEERVKAEQNYNREIQYLHADALEKKILAEEEAGNKIKDIAWKASQTVEEYLEREVEVTRLVEERKLAILEEYRINRQREILEKEKAQREELQARVMYTGGEAGELSAGLSMFQQGMFGMFNVMQGTDPYSIELERLQMFWEAKISLWQQGQATLEEVEAAHQEYMLALEQETNMMRLQSAQYLMTSMVGIASMLYAASDRNSKALFYLTKAAAVAQAIVNAWLAYTAALAHPPGPPTTIPLAKMVLAMGLAAAATIAATAFMGPSSGAGVGGSATGAAATSTTPSPTATTGTTTPAERPLVINIHVSGDIVNKDEWLDAFSREIIPKIRKAQEDGAR